MWNKLRHLDKDDLLEVIGLQSKRSTAETLMPAVAMFGVGLLVGAGLGLLLAPKSGEELRRDLRQRIDGSMSMLGTGAQASNAHVARP